MDLGRVGGDVGVLEPRGNSSRERFLGDVLGRADLEDRGIEVAVEESIVELVLDGDGRLSSGDGLPEVGDDFPGLGVLFRHRILLGLDLINLFLLVREACLVLGIRAPDEVNRGVHDIDGEVGERLVHVGEHGAPEVFKGVVFTILDLNGDLGAAGRRSRC